MTILFFSLLTLLAYMSGLWVLAIALKNNGTADIGYGIGFIVLIFSAVYMAGSPSNYALALAVLPLLWGLRLAVRIFFKNRGKPEDFRYMVWREQWGKHFLLRSFLQIYMLQGLIIFIIALPVTLSIVFPISGDMPNFFFAGAALWAAGFLFEAIGDMQLDRFIRNSANKGKIMMSGLWHYSRHPNYFGESLMWWGLAIAGIGLSQFFWVGFISPVLITFLLLRVSGVPLLEKRWQGKPEWEAYKARTSVFIPLPPGNNRQFIQIALAAIVVLGAAAAYLFFMPSAPVYQTQLPTTTLTIGKNTIDAELATTPAAQEQGLSGRASLPEGRGMFFVFDAPGPWGIWMKGMQFPIDIIWADANGIIVAIEHDITPATYPQSYSSPTPASYVLEVPAGYAKAHAIATGAQIVVQ